MKQNSEPSQINTVPSVVSCSVSSPGAQAYICGMQRLVGLFNISHRFIFGVCIVQLHYKRRTDRSSHGFSVEAEHVQSRTAGIRATNTKEPEKQQIFRVWMI